MSVTAEVIVTIKVKNVGSWGNSCTTEQVRDQAVEAALRKLNQRLHGAGSDADFQISGTPRVTMILAELPTS